MAFNPDRSWAMTYNQMWNLSMRDPLPRGQGHRNSSSFQFHGSLSGGYNGGKSNGGQGKKNKNDYCWNFNRGIKCKFGKRCKFIERCSYCDSPTHGIHVCPKEKKKQMFSSGGNRSNPAVTGSSDEAASK